MQHRFDSKTSYLALLFTLGMAVPVAAQPEVVSFTLVDATTGTDLQPLLNGDVLDRSSLPAALNIRARTSPPVVTSVRIVLNDDSRRARSSPYELFRTNNGNELGWLAPPGIYALSGKATEGKGASKVEGSIHSITFEIVELPAVLEPAPEPVSDEPSMPSEPPIEDTTIEVPTSDVPVVEQLEFTDLPTQIAVDQVIELSIIAHWSDATLNDVTSLTLVSTSDPTIASIDGAGVLTATGSGTVTLSASFDGISTSASLEVLVPFDTSTAPWIETTPNSLSSDSGNFLVAPVGDCLGIRINAPESNRHYHLASPNALSMQNYVFTGRMRTADPMSGFGVTFYSGYPNEDAYYRLRATSGAPFEIDPRHVPVNGGNRYTTLVPEADVWYRFRIVVTTEVDRTSIRARVWVDGESEPEFDQIDCFANTAGRRTSGTIGCWMSDSGEKSFSDLAINGVLVGLERAGALEFAVEDPTLDVGESTALTATEYNREGAFDATNLVTFDSSEPGVIQIQSGEPPMALAAAPGSADIFAVLDDMTTEAGTVTVIDSAIITAPVLQPAPTEDNATPTPGIPSGTTSSLSQNGITWTFASPVTYGQFVNGDYWILGPAQIVSINPPSFNVNGRIQHGSQINPSPVAGIQSYDNTLYGVYLQWAEYRHSDNVAFEVSASNPLTVNAGDSLCSSITHDTAGVRPGIRTVAVLTVMDQAPPDGSFRPPYYAGPKPLYNIADVQTGLLQSYTPAPGMPSFSSQADKFSRVWFEQSWSWLHTFEHPSDNMPFYGRDVQKEVSISAVMLNTDATLETKMPLLIGLLQVGIDFDGFRMVGGSWAQTDGGNGAGHKFPVVFKRKMFGESLPLQSPETLFMLDAQTFFVEETSSGVYNYGYGGYGPGQVGMPEWGKQYWVAQPGLSAGPPGYHAEGFNWVNGPSNYRRCCNYISSAGGILAARMMGMIEEYGHPAGVEYQDRYMLIEQDGAWTRQWDEWTEDMWDLYRPSFGDYAIPSTWIPSDAP